MPLADESDSSESESLRDSSTESEERRARASARFARWRFADRSEVFEQSEFGGELTLFDDLAITLIRESNTVRDHGFASTHTVLEDPMGYASFGRLRHAWIGHVQYLGIRYELRSLPHDGVMIAEIATLEEPCGNEDVLVTTPTGDHEPAGNGPRASPLGITGSEIAVLVLYTSAARVEAAPVGSPTDRTFVENSIRTAMDEANTILDRSGVTHRLRLAAMLETTHSENSTVAGDHLDWMRGELATPYSWTEVMADTVNADLISLWTSQLTSAAGTNICGLGERPQTSIDVQDGPGLSVVEFSCAMNNYSFIHEVGHNFGAAHDSFVAPSATTIYPYSFGYTDKVLNAYTIMAYSNDCQTETDTLANPCNRLPRFSGRGVRWGGRRLGSAVADNAQTIQNTGARVAEYSRYY